MDAAYITPFVASIQNVFGTMLQLPVEVGDPRLLKSDKASHDISGIIGMTGTLSGSVVLSLPQETADAIVALFCGERIDADSPDFADAIGELVNMISGGAKASFEGQDVSISCPNVVIGPGHKVSRPSDIPCVVIPCTTDCGELAIEVAIRETAPSAPADANADASANATA
ncbi:MAG: chemotaxis protein CheX [Planctomycetota bacterium]